VGRRLLPPHDPLDSAHHAVCTAWLLTYGKKLERMVFNACISYSPRYVRKNYYEKRAAASCQRPVL